MPPAIRKLKEDEVHLLHVAVRTSLKKVFERRRMEPVLPYLYAKPMAGGGVELYGSERYWDDDHEDAHDAQYTHFGWRILADLIDSIKVTIASFTQPFNKKIDERWVGSELLKSLHDSGILYENPEAFCCIGDPSALERWLGGAIVHRTVFTIFGEDVGAVVGSNVQTNKMLVVGPEAGMGKSITRQLARGRQHRHKDKRDANDLSREERDASSQKLVAAPDATRQSWKSMHAWSVCFRTADFTAPQYIQPHGSYNQLQRIYHIPGRYGMHIQRLYVHVVARDNDESEPSRVTSDAPDDRHDATSQKHATQRPTSVLCV